MELKEDKNTKESVHEIVDEMKTVIEDISGLSPSKKKSETISWVNVSERKSLEREDDSLENLTTSSTTIKSTTIKRVIETSSHIVTLEVPAPVETNLSSQEVKASATQKQKEICSLEDVEEKEEDKENFSSEKVDSKIEEMSSTSKDEIIESETANLMNV